VAVRVSSLQVTDVADLFRTAPEASEWRLIYETEPCLPLEWTVDEREVAYRNGSELGGRMIIEAGGSILVTVGDG